MSLYSPARAHESIKEMQHDPRKKASLDGGKIKVHNSELFVETMQSADWSEPSPQKTVLSASSSSKRGGKHGSASKRGSRSPRGTDDGAAHDQEKTKKTRDAFLEKQHLREAHFRQRFEIARKEAEKKAQEKRMKKEKDFEERFGEFVHNNSTLVQEVDGAVCADEAWRQRKKERLFNEWTLKVFQPMQDQINVQLASVSSEEVEQQRRYMLQCFLDESNKKKNGLFRDIIIESDYDPMAQMRSSTLKYSRANIADDPTKNRATREAGDRMSSGLLKKDIDMEKIRANDKRSFVSVEMWDRMESTPYGRYSNESEGKRPFKPDFLKSNVNLDHYNVVKGSEGANVVKMESGGARGKKPVTGAPSMYQKSEVADCLFMPGTPVEQLPSINRRRK